MTDLYAKDGCKDTYWMGQERPRTCPHGHPYESEKALRRSVGSDVGRTTGKDVHTPRSTDECCASVASSTPRRKPLKRGRGFSASKEQREKVRDLACIVCGSDRHETRIDPAHVYPRRLAHCDCADGVVPLCAEHHGAYDDPDKTLDLLPVLVANRLHVELYHAAREHEAPIFHVLQVITGVEWVPVGQERATA